MTEERRLLLKATKHNWGELHPGDWLLKNWLICSDATFEYLVTFRSESKPAKRTVGKMDKEAFSQLCEAIKREPWRDPSIDVHACDGAAWEIVSYNEDGQVDKTSGELDYIYGHEVLETIVSLLPG